MQKSIDVLLISPNGFSYQLMLDKIFPRKHQYDYALCALAANLQEKGFAVKIIDGFAQDLTIDKIINLVIANKPKIVGITSCSSTIKEVSVLAEKLKKIKTENSNFKNLEIILGGRHITKMPNLIKEFGVKYALLGDAEYTLPTLCDYIIHNKDTKNISNGIAEYSDGKIRVENIESIKNIDFLPIQNLNLFVGIEQKFKPNFIFIEASRGCPNMCYFCATPSYRRKVVYKSPEKVVEEIKILSSKYKTNFFIFIDGTFSSNREHTLEICRLLRKKNIKCEWACSDRIDTLDKELLKEMKSAGCYAIFFGIEAGSKKIREVCNKSFTEEKCLEIFKLCNEIGITPSGNFIIGHPNETIFDIEETIKLAMKLENSEIFFKPLILLPDSIIYEQLLNNKTIDPNFYHTSSGKPLLLNTYSGLTEEVIEKQIIRAYRKYYFRIKPTLKILFIQDIQTQYQALKFRWIIAIESFKREICSPLINFLKNGKKIKNFVIKSTRRKVIFS